MNVNDATLLDQLRCATRKTIAEFSASPMDFLYESDIQSLMFAKLRDEMLYVRYKFETKDFEERVGFIPIINPVKSEYPSDRRFDIAVLSEKPDPTCHLWLQPCRIAIEIKFWQVGSGGHPRRDVDELQLYWQASKINGRPFTGIAMLFVQPAAEQRLEDCKKLGDIICNGSNPQFPDDGIAFHLVTSSSWSDAILKRTDL
ncbi:MAG TPA: hypothetical protein VMV39_05055 [Terracidiphilus sp.]|nr:hypothetical protein [Terracidiphilus sp.]